MNAQRTQLWIALVCLAIGGFVLHYRIHQPQGRLTFFWASFFSGVDAVLVSLLFLFKRTALWGLLLNSFLAFIGIIMMTDYSIVLTLRGKIPFSPFSAPLSWVMMSLFPDIAVALASFLVGLALYKETSSQSRPAHTGRA